MLSNASCADLLAVQRKILRFLRNILLSNCSPRAYCCNGQQGNCLSFELDPGTARRSTNDSDPSACRWKLETQLIGIQMKKQVLKLLNHEDGLTTVEYAVAAAVIAAAIVAAFGLLGLLRAQSNLDRSYHLSPSVWCRSPL